MGRLWANLQTVVCRDATTPPREGGDAKEKIAIVLVSHAGIVRNGDASFKVVHHLSTMGHKSYSGAHARFTDLRVPQANTLYGPGPQAVESVRSSFDNTGVLVGAMALRGRWLMPRWRSQKCIAAGAHRHFLS
ncbi:hypothetical protein P171DRAFT_500009 [Karstenula rhodostoma CBS 690.94]|uniref:Uncharacterized protein n=1 Tax=Karstenula rhodostoma CBS 690.94 TaxID=1392251 RepID=A0A9P4PAW2_9PLEO|nr:hypothetical protein P171DRAFT_500009 [Karstenula rhodostoma CBS 690.94]